eukprot:XP_008671229.2 uncharacterized protein LOC103648558 [Zea mays]
MVFRAVPIPGEIFCHPTLPYFSLDSAQIRAVGRTIFDRELFHVDLDDAPVFDADTDNLSVEPIFDDVVFEDIEPNFDDLDDEPLFDTKFDELDKGSVFDTESIPDHVAVSVFEFVRPEYDAELTVFDTDSDSLNDLPVVDMGPVHDAELAVFNQGNDGSSTAHTGVLDGHPVFDVELVFDEEPLIEIDCSIFNTNAPFMCLTDCLSYVDDMVSATFKEGHIFDKETVVEAVQKESGRDYYTAHGGTTYVHCKAGRGRSTTIVLCYLIKYRNMTPEAALDHVRSIRPRVLLAPSQWHAISSFGALTGGQLPVWSTNLACFLEAIEAGCTNTGNDTIVQQDNIDKENDSAMKLDVSSSMEKPSGQGPEESILESDVIMQGMSSDDMTKEKDLNIGEAT